MTDYTPIDCGKYSEYELAIMHAQQLRISWREPDGQLHVAVITPTDLVTRDHEEFLLADDASGGSLELRLDYIIKTEPF